ncbi:hypothetical protein HYH03_007182 [Edaphochlamys debaryana]|uniref:Uncharacterized protein n=1 Tax=Edaphochlamys debaryana TaxID=47281 RepID=A0A836BZD1_9CHLO|nr:hypothetical protein HYH03_007182 [Edaphochlamys debaryana]|eukprot:KAG2494666.1 hypothetical protein HYH03_007182 [Edaphochlamys debaryana]
MTVKCDANSMCIVAERLGKCVCKPGYVRDTITGSCVANKCPMHECIRNEFCEMANATAVWSTRLAQCPTTQPSICVCNDKSLTLNPATGLCEACDLACGVGGSCAFTKTGTKICKCDVTGFTRDLGTGLCVVNLCRTTPTICRPDQRCAVRNGATVCVCIDPSLVVGSSGSCVAPA